MVEPIYPNYKSLRIANRDKDSSDTYKVEVYSFLRSSDKLKSLFLEPFCHMYTVNLKNPLFSHLLPSSYLTIRNMMVQIKNVKIKNEEAAKKPNE